MNVMSWTVRIPFDTYRAAVIGELLDGYCDPAAASKFDELNELDIRERFGGMSPEMAASKFLDYLDGES